MSVSALAFDSLGLEISFLLCDMSKCITKFYIKVIWSRSRSRSQTGYMSFFAVGPPPIERHSCFVLCSLSQITASQNYRKFVWNVKRRPYISTLFCHSGRQQWEHTHNTTAKDMLRYRGAMQSTNSNSLLNSLTVWAYMYEVIAINSAHPPSAASGMLAI